MIDKTRENLTELLRQFMDPAAARAAEADIRAGQRLLEAWPAPTPDRRVLADINARMVAHAVRRRRIHRIFHGSMATAAAIVMMTLIGLLNHGSTDSPGLNYATLIPASVWESQNIMTDDLELVYYASQIRQIEAQVQAVETGEPEVRSKSVLDELEMELMQIETEFWKG